MTGIFEGVKIEADFAASAEELIGYIDEVAKEAKCPKCDIESIDLHLEGENVKINYTVKGESFERIRRIN